MSAYYCHFCALRQNLYVPIDSTVIDLTGTPYQFDKYIKHTMPNIYSNILSIFNTPDYNMYLDYTVNSSLSGCVEIDNQSRMNIIYYAGHHTGMTFKNGKYYCADDSVKVVYPYDPIKIHSFPVNIQLQYIDKCIICGSDILV